MTGKLSIRVYCREYARRFCQAIHAEERGDWGDYCVSFAVEECLNAYREDPRMQEFFNDCLRECGDNINCVGGCMEAFEPKPLFKEGD